MEEKKNPFASLSDKELEAMLKRLEDSNERQASYAKKQYRMSQITALASILILAIVIYTSATIIPRVNRLFDDVETVMDSVNVVAKELEEEMCIRDRSISASSFTASLVTTKKAAFTSSFFKRSRSRPV